MKSIEIHKRCSDFQSYRAARVKSLFNVESGADFSIIAELPTDQTDWSLGVIVGPSGSGKTSLGQGLWGGGAFYEATWPGAKPIIDAIQPTGDFNAVTAALAAVGLGSVPSWLRPYSVLSNGERFRADLARTICDAPPRVVVDEFTSVVDRQIAKFGAMAFAKAWRRTGGQAVLLSCHYDILEWIEPDWIFDTATGKLSARCLRRPSFDLDIWQTNWSHWPLFEPHHYLKAPHMVAATNYVGTVDGQPVCHVAFSTRPGLVEARACRLVVMPEWQGAGVGMRFLNAICELWRQGENRYHRPMPTLFHTSHPGLAAGLRRDKNWTQVSAVLHGSHKGRCIETLQRSSIAAGGWGEKKETRNGSGGFGGHFRAVQGFRYLGKEALCGS